MDGGHACPNMFSEGPCEECEKFSNLSTRRSFGKKQLVKCDVCFKILRKGSLKGHYKMHTREPADEPFKCKLCNKVFIDQTTLDSHSEIHSVKNEMCKETSTSESNESVTPGILSAQKPAEHEIASNIPVSGEQLNNHSHQKYITCEICSKTFVSKACLKNHYRIHTGEKPFECEICYKVFRKKSTLSIHFRIHTGEKHFKCRLCDKSFAQFERKEFTEHVKTHSSKNPFECKICQLPFPDKSDLIMHQHVGHIGEKTYKCRNCGELFPDIVQMNMHKQTHCWQRPYVCKVCKQPYAKKIYLDRHMVIHTDAKPQCDMCDKVLATKYSLIAHKRLHTGEKPFECKWCCKSFAFKGKLMSHRKKFGCPSTELGTRQKLN